MWLKKLFILFCMGIMGIYCCVATAAAPKAIIDVVSVTPAPVSDANISVWTNEIIVQIYTFDATHTNERLKDIANYFTPDGWSVFLQALNESKILETVKQNNYKVTAVALNPPRITAKGPIRGQYSWTVVMPTLISYHNKISQYKQYLDITLTIVYTGQKSGIRGLSMTQFITKQQAKPALCQCS